MCVYLCLLVRAHICLYVCLCMVVCLCVICVVYGSVSAHCVQPVSRPMSDMNFALLDPASCTPRHRVPGCAH